MRAGPFPMLSVARWLFRALAGGLFATALLAALLLAPGAVAAQLADDGGAKWRVEHPLPLAPPGTETSEVSRVAGAYWRHQVLRPQSRRSHHLWRTAAACRPGVWFYDGATWRELSNQCGATDGRIAWSGPG